MLQAEILMLKRTETVYR